ncbi:hypothetical protein SAMN05216388_10628 [Halorientalis persicus]|uniref:Uncharacterized protein n=1 Tax=Halorientalis persicus TaxID=1367881 RepID=A0A1H8WJV7_9EURY|nr:hypothetical protein [Halorientalis persicus]SEP27926.1 hypothetical protein SAMN05216388_10628 [Halorientalis persicus]
MTESEFTQSEFDVDHLRAQNVLQALQDFAAEVRQRRAVTQVKKVARNAATQFKGGYVDQAPEYFTEQYLIESVLDQLALGPWPRPVELVKDEQRRPDYRLRDVATNCLAIGESKALNRERNQGKATEDIKGYLHDETFLKTLRREEVRYSIGIATDGLKWRLFARDIDTGVQLKVADCSISEPVAMVLEKAHSEVDPAEDWTPDARRRIANTLVAAFSRENIVSTAVAGLES